MVLRYMVFPFSALAGLLDSQGHLLLLCISSFSRECPLRRFGFFLVLVGFVLCLFFRYFLLVRPILLFLSLSGSIIFLGGGFSRISSQAPFVDHSPSDLVVFLLCIPSLKIFFFLIQSCVRSCFFPCAWLREDAWVYRARFEFFSLPIG